MESAVGPLAGVRVVELAGLGPGPFACMMLADAGADVVRVDRPPDAPAALSGGGHDVLARGRRSVAVNLRSAEGADVVLRLVEQADVLVEGFRPGVTERLGVGPDACLARNPRLVYGRVTGWGQEGPWSRRAGHDLDYIAVSGALHPIGRAGEPPPPPLNYVGDFGGGGMLLAFGVLAAVLAAQRSGRGQVVDAAMVDGAAVQTASVHGHLAGGGWREQRETNLLDGAAPFYRCYACSDGRYLAVGALEPKFYAELLELLGLDPDEWPQDDRSRWPEQCERLAALFATRSRDDWMTRFEGSDACVAPVLSPAEAPAHPQLAARGTFVALDGVTQPGPAPRFSKTASHLGRPPAAPGSHTDEVLGEAGFTAADIDRLRDVGAVA